MVSMIVTAIAFSSASARGEELPGSRSETSPSPVVIEVARDGFDWEDAGVGAAGALAVVAIGFGLALIVRDRPDLPDLHPTTKREG